VRFILRVEESGERGGRGLLVTFHNSFPPASEREARMDDPTRRCENDTDNETHSPGPPIPSGGLIFLPGIPRKKAFVSFFRPPHLFRAKTKLSSVRAPSPNSGALSNQVLIDLARYGDGGLPKHMRDLRVAQP